MIFKTYETDLDGISNKLGFNKRSFAEWGIQVSQSFNNAGKGLKGFKEAFKTAFIVPQKLDEIKLINEANFSSVFPVENAKSFFENFNKRGSQSIATLTQWCDELGVTDKTMKAYLVDCMQKQVPTSFEGYNNYVQSAIANNKQLTLSAKATAVGMKALSIAGNMLAAWAITKVISLATTAIDNLANASKHAAENAAALASEMNNSISSMSSNASTLSDLNDEYQKLSKGVNRLGENVSLSTEDYSRYKDIISQVSTIMPGLTTYFNAQGEKIAFARGELQDLNEEYNEYIKNQAIDYVTNGDSDDHKIQDILDNYNNNESVSGFEAFWRELKYSLALSDINDFSSKDIINELKKIINSESIDEAKKELTLGKTWHFSLSEHDTALSRAVMKELGLTTKEIDSMTEADYNALIQSIESYIQTYEAKITSDMNQVRTALFQEAYSKDEFWQINDTDIRDNIITFLSSIDSDIWDELDKKTENELSTFVNKIIESMSDNTDGFADAWNGLFDPELKDLPVNEYAQQVDSFLKSISKVLGLDETDGVPILKFSLGFDDIDDIAKRLQNSIRSLVDDHGMENREILNSDEYKELLEITNGFTEAQAELWLTETQGAENITEAIKRYKEALESVSDTNAPITLSTILTNSADSLDKFQSSVKSAADAYATLLSGDYSSTELLDSIQAINQAATDMGESIAWEEIDSLDLLGDKLEEVSQKYLENIADIDVDSGFGKILANIIQAQKASTQLEVLNGQIDSLQSAYSDLTDIVASYNDTGHLTFDQLQKLLEMEPQYLACLVDENGQLQLNEAAMTALANQRLDDAEAQAIQQAITELGMLAMQDEESAVKENAQAFNNAINDLAGYNEELANTIAETGVATSLIRDLNAALQGAESDGATDDQIDTVLNNLKAKLQLIGNVSKQIDNDGLDSVFGSAGKSAGEAFTDALDKELAALDKKMEAGYIDFNDYIQARLALIEDYYNQGKLSADEYYSYLEKHYDTQLSYMDKVVNVVTRRIDTELDALKQQKEDVENIYRVRIESLEKEKTLLEEANKERQRQKDLEKSLYDLERARNQRTKLVYSEDKGMHYVADDQSIRDAQEDVDNARYDIKIAEIEKTISNLEEARDKQTNAIDDMISNLESYKDAWNDVTSAYEEEQENLIAAQVLGANWETDILNGRLDVLDAFKDQYISIQQAMVDAAWKSANEQVKAAKEAEKGSSGSTSKAPKINGNNDIPKTDPSQLPKMSGGGGGGLLSLGLGSNKLAYTSFKAYASGTNNAKKGLNLVGEDGTETYFDNHGHVAIVTKPTLIPMDGGEVVKNERDTKKLLDPDNLAPVDTIGLADIDGKQAEYTIKVNVETNGEIPDVKGDSSTKAKTFTLSDGTELTPIQSDSFMWDLQEKYNTYISKIGEDISSTVASVASIQKDVNRMVNSANTVNNMTSNGMRQITIGDIHVTCPGVTEQQVAERLGNVIGKELNRQFNGFSLIALQESKK